MKNSKVFCIDKWLASVLYLLVSISLVMFSGCSKDTTKEYPAPDPFISEMTEAIQADTMRTTVFWLQQMQTRFFLAGNHRDVARQLQERFLLMGYENTKLDSFQLEADYNGTIYQTWQYNVIATLEGSQHTERVSVLGAHYDCIVEDGDPFVFSPGADDNGSGIAAVLEIARVTKEFNFKPASAIHFILFAAEEYDLNGSADYCNKALSKGTMIQMMLNQDMIGYQPDDSPESWVVNIMDYPNSGTLPDDAERICAQYTSLVSETDNRYSDEGDSYSFSRNGVPSLFFISWEENPDYHSIHDQITHCNFSYAREVGKISLALMVERAR
jgi:hypothetical protein